MATVTDPDWLAAFGTTDSQIEKPPKGKTQKLARHQQQAKLISERPELFDPNKRRPRTTLFD